MVRQGTYKLCQPPTSYLPVAQSASQGYSGPYKFLSRVPHPQQVLSKTFYVLVPGFWHLHGIHVS